MQNSIDVMTEAADTFEPAKPLGLSRSAIEQLAERFAKAYDYSPSQSLQEMVRAYGGRLYEKDFAQDRGNADSIEVRDENDFDIFVASHANETQNRFTVAHELGHYVCHYWARRALGEPVGPLCASRYGPIDDPAEREANWFAMAYLMSRARAEEAYLATSGSVAGVASLLRVPLDIAEARLRQFDVIATPDSNHGARILQGG